MFLAVEFQGGGKLQTFGEILKPLLCFQVWFDPLLERVQTHILPAALGIRVWAASHVPVACSKISDKMPKSKDSLSGRCHHYLTLEQS